ncbi:M50 family metallopeptidase [Aquihabitans sp. McL0605]|uniref:M50 family metallopeptidase n=1 Tax=Aquihabitans sp. McL0605 TaxID=3415671 RepID=UPI003CF5829F
MPDLPPSTPSHVEPPTPADDGHGRLATAERTAVDQEPGEGIPTDGAGVPFAGLRLAGLLGALVLLGVWNFWFLIVVLAIVVMITLHELGHYLTAKRAGMKVTEFFLGFGPKIWSVRRGETEYGIKAIPAGAYVKIPGMVNLDEVDPEDEARTYRQKSFGSRVSVAVAGSAMHFMLALVLIYVALVFVGQPGKSFAAAPKSPTPIVERVVTGSGADKAGLQPGDEIRAIEGTRTPTTAKLRSTAAPLYGTPAEVTYVRDGVTGTTVVDLRAYTYTADDGSKQKACGLGIVMQDPPNEKVGPVQGLYRAPVEFKNIMTVSMKGLTSFFSPSGISDFSSQVGSANKDRSTQKQTEAADEKDPCSTAAAAAVSGSGTQTGENRILSIYGLVRLGSSVGGVDPSALIALFAFINIFIGVFNLIPLLPFDGGHVAIAVYENIQERRLHRRRYFADVSRLLPITYVVVLLLGMLFVSSLYLDVVNPIGG